MSWWMISDIAFLLLAALAGTIFTVVYTWRTRWWREEHRAHLGIFTLTLTIMLWLYVFRAIIPVPTFVIIRRVFFDLVALLMVWRLVLLFRSKRSDRERRDREDVHRDVQSGTEGVPDQGE
jgi:hypothetical protein